MTDTEDIVVPADTDAPAWFCVQSKPQQEAWAEEQLRRQRIGVYVPRLRIRRPTRRRMTTVLRPMFPGYLFAHFNYAEQFKTVGYTLGVRRVVAFGESPTPVDEAIVEEIRRHEDGDGVVILRPEPLRPGESVVITEGPFRGLEAVFQQDLPDQQRVAILLEEIAFRARLVVDRSWVRPV